MDEASTDVGALCVESLLSIDTSIVVRDDNTTHCLKMN